MTVEEAIWTSYTDLEARMGDYLQYVPWEATHVGVWSPKLADLLLVAGSSIDSAFRAYIGSAHFNSVPGIEEIRNKQKSRLTLTDFRNVFSSVYPLGEADVTLNVSGERLYPWHSWAEGGSGKAPEWWTAYNQVKHDKFDAKAIRGATLGTTMNALAGFIAVSAWIVEMRGLLTNQGRLMHMGEKVPQGFARILTTPDPRADPQGFSSPIWVETQLFSVPLYRTGAWLPPPEPK